MYNMNKNIMTRDELIARFNVPEAALREWEKLKLLKPIGLTDDGVSLYSEDLADRLRHVQKLQELGYAPEDIQKILKKVGLPKSGRIETRPAASEQYLTVGQLAERVELSPRTIKHWEDKGIIEPDMRTEGGFRLYSGIYIQLYELIRDLQLFGYTLDEIKQISDDFREFLSLKNNLENYSRDEADLKLDKMLEVVRALNDKMSLLKKGVEHWEGLLKKQKKDILNLKHKNGKRGEKPAGKKE
jgi:DNA-binding transcriptional MerR regulator